MLKSHCRLLLHLFSFLVLLLPSAGMLFPGMLSLLPSSGSLLHRLPHLATRSPSFSPSLTRRLLTSSPASPSSLQAALPPYALAVAPELASAMELLERVGEEARFPALESHVLADPADPKIAGLSSKPEESIAETKAFSSSFSSSSSSSSAFHPLCTPLLSSASSSLHLCLLTTPLGSGLVLASPNSPVQPLTNTVDQYVLRHLSNLEFGSNLSPSLVATYNAHKSPSSPPHALGSIPPPFLKYGPEKYALLKVGPFADLYAAVAAEKLEKMKEVERTGERESDVLASCEGEN